MPDAETMLAVLLAAMLYMTAVDVVHGVKAVAKKTAHGVVWVVHHLEPHHTADPNAPSPEPGVPSP